MRKKYSVIFLVTFFIALGTGFGFYYYKKSKEIKQPKLAVVSKPGEGIRPFAFINQNGDTITETALKNKVAVVEYFFTTCMGICPKMNENMTKVHQVFKNNNNFVILSHTVDPLKDSVAALKAYSQRFNAAGNNWHFLTGDKKELYDQARRSYQIAVEDVPENINEDFIHSNLFVLIDKKGKIRMKQSKDGTLHAYDGTDTASVSQLIEDIKYLLTEE